MKTVENGCWTYVPTGEIEVSQRRRVYKAYFLDEFEGYRIRVRAKQLVKGKEKLVGFQFVPCKKVYEDIDGKLKFIVC